MRAHLLALALFATIGISFPASAQDPLTSQLADLGVPVVGRLTAPATADGGDMFWIDDATLAVGRSYRTNAVAVAQLEEILRPRGVRVEVYDVPHDQGPEWCLHLMSVVSPVREDLAVVYERLAPVAMLEELRRRGVVSGGLSGRRPES